MIGDILFYDAYKKNGGREKISSEKKKIKVSTKLREMLDNKKTHQLLGNEFVYLLRVFMGFPMGINVTHNFFL